MYVLIKPIDGLVIVKAPATSENVRLAVGEPGPALIRLQLHLEPALCGHCNDTAHPQQLDRNIIGGLVLVQLGAPAHLYAGPVVITGWDVDHQPTEVCDLTEHQAALVSDVYGYCCSVMAGFGTSPRTVELYDYARWCRETPRPTPTVSRIEAS